jgi:uncharacterized protein (DUF58 family)
MSSIPGVTLSLDDLLRIRLRITSRQRWHPRPRISAAARVGHAPSRFRGRGIDFEEVRRYQPGDDIRTMDWRVTARTGHPHTKLFREERERPLHILLDFTPTMAFGTRRCFKSVTAAEAAAWLAWNGMRHADRVGGMIVTSAGDHWESRPSGGTHGVIALLHGIVHHFPHPGVPSSIPATLSQPLARLRKVIRPGGQIAVLSDFIAWNADVERHLIHLSRHNDMALLLVHDPLEAHLPDAGWLGFGDGRHTLSINSSDARMRHAFNAQFETRRLQLRDLCRKQGALFAPLSTAEDPIEVLNTLPWR